MRAIKGTKGEGKRREILEAAGRTFLRNGLRGASIAGICKEAGVSPGHLYHYFDSKEAILEAIAESYLTETEAYFETRKKSDDVISMIVSGIERAARMPVTVQALLFEMIAEASRNPKIADLLQMNTTRIRSFYAELIRRGQEQGEVGKNLCPEMAASVVINMIDAAKMAHMRDADTDLAARISALETMVRRFLSATG